MVENNERKVIVGVGSALVDLLAHEDDSFVEKVEAAKGGMLLVDEPKIEEVISQLSSKPITVPGGSACDTIVGVGSLGGNARFVGKLGEDPLGRLFKTGLLSSHVEPLLSISPQPTGRVLSIITPDAQRSMLTYLGASAELRPEEITKGLFTNAAIVHLEGYLLFNRDLFAAVVKAAKSAGARISLDLASYTVVEAAGEFLHEMTKEYVDILLANEDEARAFTGEKDEEKSLQILATYADTAVLKVGSRGSVISHHGDITHISPTGSGPIVDTTGAGDLWAAGFLYSMVRSFPIERCGNIASACGYEVCRVIGAVIPPDGWARIKQLV